MRVDWRRGHVRLDDRRHWWVQVIVQVDKVLLLLEARRHQHRRLLHHYKLLGKPVVGDVLRLIAQGLAHINTPQVAVVVDMKVEVGRKFKLIW